MTGAAGSLERDDALKQVEEWARRAAARKPEAESDNRHAELRLFIDGDADAALKLLIAARSNELPPAAQADYDKHVLSFGDELMPTASGNQVRVSTKYAAYLGKYHKEIDLGEFYRRVHRLDLAEAYEHRRFLKRSLTIGGATVFGTSIACALAYGLFTSDETSGIGARIQDSKTVGLTAMAVASVGFAAYFIGYYLPNEPIEPDEMRRLVDDYNATLRARLRVTTLPTSVPFRARLTPYIARRGGGMVLEGKF
jgi:hypothetical protein